MMIFASKMRQWLRMAMFLALAALPSARAIAQSGGDTVFRIVVQQDTREEDARSFKLHLEGLGYVPIVLGDFKNGLATVYYGNFPNAREADKAKKELARNGISAIQIVQMRRNDAAEAGKAYTIQVFESREPILAAKMKDKLESEGSFDIKVYKSGDMYRVGSGSYNSNSVAQNVLATVRNNGYADAKIVEVAQMGQVTEVSATTGVKATPAADEKIKVGDLLPKDLTPEQKAQIEKMLDEREKIKASKSSTVDAELEAWKKQMEEKLGGVVKNVEELTTKFDKERADQAARANKVAEVARLTRDADVMARGKKWEEAIKMAKEALALDPENTYLPPRIHAWELQALGKGPLEQDEEIQRMKDQANALEKENDEVALNSAVGFWRTIKVKDASSEGEADAKIQNLTRRIEELRRQAAPKPANDLLPWILTGALGFLVAMIAVVFYMRSRKQHREMLARIQEATAMRPMRGIYGQPENQIGGGGMGGELPMPQGWPQAGGGAPQTMAPPQAAPSSVDSLFGGGDSFDPLGAAPVAPPPPPAPAAQPRMAATISESELNDLFGGPSESAPPKPAPSAPPPSPPKDAFEPMSDLFAPLEEEKPKPKVAAPPPPDDSPALSLDDLLGGGGETTRQMQAPPPQAQVPVSAPAPAVDPFDLLGTPPPAPAPTASPFAGTPFDDLLGGPPAPAVAPPPPIVAAPPREESIAYGGGDETLIERAPSPTQINQPLTVPTGMSIPELKSLNLSNLKAAEETISGFDGDSASIPGGGIVFTQNFEQDEIGKQPANWQGTFSFAELTVQNDTPPAGNRNYLVYKKDDGIGKVYYSAKFPNTSGILSVEFDLRCNDKNKFLLGFYIEKDEDFQQSIHTKILRSESQTAPSIHVHGQPAPYLLGTWAHIRYVINLIEGKVDGYVDDRHVAKGVTLPQVPKYMNTLAIRDNINTTGSLFIDNILIRKLE